MPGTLQSNLGEVAHGGAILTFIGMAMFAGAHAAGCDIGPAVTQDFACQFLSAARLGVPLDCAVQVLRESKRLVSLRGLVEQESETVASWIGTLRKLSRP